MADTSARETPSFDGLLGGEEDAELLAETALLSGLEERLFGRAPSAARIARYRLLEPLGRGGFGLVYAAHDPELGRKVALKLLHRREPGGGESSSRERADLLTEAQALAKFSHANVVSVFDVGEYDLRDEPLGVVCRSASVGERGVFVVMEYVDGPNLAAWLAASTRSRGSILQLFVEAGRGLAAAHDAGLVHRDFKPANVVVDARGHAKVVDFGLAALARTGEGANEPGRITGTPAYMAPEQHAGAPADGRADQFAFCVALFEALHGRLPFPSGGDLEAMADAKQRAGAALPDAPTHVPAWVRRVLRRGLASEPADRYPDMHALLTDLDPAVRRRRFRIGGLALGIAAAAAAGFAFAPSPGDPCAVDTTAAAGIWDERARSEARASFAATDLEYADQSWRKVDDALGRYLSDWAVTRRRACEDTLVRHGASAEVMARRMLCLDRGLRRVAGVTPLLRSADRHVVQRAVEQVASLPELGDCMRPTIDPPVAMIAGPAREAVLDVEERVARALGLMRFGSFEPAASAAEDAVARARVVGDDSTLARAQDAWAQTLHAAGRLEDAQAAIDEAMLAAERAGDVDAALSAMIEGVQILDSRARHEEADRLAALTQARLERIEPRGSQAASLAFNIGVLRLHEARYDDAEAALERGLGIRRALYGDDHPRLASFYNTLGNVEQKRGRPERARAHLARALEIWSEAYGPDHPDVARVLNNLGNAWRSTGDYDQALATYRRALRTYERGFEPDHPSIAIIRHNLGLIHDTLGRHHEALSDYERAMAIRERKLARDHPQTASTIHNMGSTLRALGRADEAIEHYRRAARMRASSLGESHPEVAQSLDGLASALADAGRLADAKAAMHRADAIESARSSTQVRSAHATVALAEGDLEAARSMLEAILDERMRQAGADHPSTWWAQVDLGRLLVRRGDVQAGLAQLEPALRRLGETVGESSPDLAPGVLATGHAEIALGRGESGAASLRRAVVLACGPDGHPGTCADAKAASEAAR